jgi:hypothetical protein
MSDFFGFAGNLRVDRQSDTTLHEYALYQKICIAELDAGYEHRSARSIRGVNVGAQFLRQEPLIEPRLSATKPIVKHATVKNAVAVALTSMTPREDR